MWRFLMPLPDGSVFDLTLGAKSLHHAYLEFARDWFCQIQHTATIAVFNGRELTGRVQPVLNLETLELEPRLEAWE